MPPNRFESEVESFLEGSHGDRTHIKRADHPRLHHYAGRYLPSVFLPGAWGQIGQMMVPGASSTLLRSIAYFPEATTSDQWLVLGSWIAFGLLTGVIGWALKERRTATVEA